MDKRIDEKVRALGRLFSRFDFPITEGPHMCSAIEVQYFRAVKTLCGLHSEQLGKIGDETVQLWHLAIDMGQDLKSPQEYLSEFTKKVDEALAESWASIVAFDASQATLVDVEQVESAGILTYCIALTM
jgi:hypothetical protein